MHKSNGRCHRNCRHNPSLCGRQKDKKGINQNVIVHPSITQDFLHEIDFTGSIVKAVETNDYLYLNQSYNVKWNKISDITKSKSICNVPIHEIYMYTIQGYYQQDHMDTSICSSRNHMFNFKEIEPLKDTTQVNLQEPNL